MTIIAETVPTSRLVDEVSEELEYLPKHYIKEVISEFLESVHEHIVSGEKVRLNRVGVVSTKERAARRGRNPRTGEEIEIPAARKISFRSSKSLKEKLNVKRRKRKR